MADIEQQARELLPCPFCGNTDLDIGQWIECHKCGAIGPGDDLGDPLDMWNERHGVAPVTLATVKPPANLRTQVRATSDLKDCTHG